MVLASGERSSGIKLRKRQKLYRSRTCYSISSSLTLYKLLRIKILNIKKPKSIEVKEIESEMLKNFYKESKKVSNKKMKSFFNYNLKFPTYVEGLNYIRNNIL